MVTETDINSKYITLNKILKVKAIKERLKNELHIFAQS
jgi:hypothetical protein